MKKIIQKAKIPWSKKLSKSLSLVRRSQASQLVSPSEDNIGDSPIKQNTSTYNDAVLVEISLNWTQEEEQLVEIFCSEKDEPHESSISYFNESPTSAIIYHQTIHNHFSDELTNSPFNPEEFIVKEYYSASMREIVADLNRLDKDIEDNVSTLKSIVKKNFDQYLSAFTILQELHSLRLRPDPFTSLEHTLLELEKKISFITMPVIEKLE